ncbi:MAG: hypothetical protein EOO88_05510 [Pedobacter sp.]|nr:MAG: hypothetical protein EOO88_05510 [Pedobacter sp.]
MAKIKMKLSGLCKFSPFIRFASLLVLLSHQTTVSAQQRSTSLVAKPVFGAHALIDQGHLLHDRLYGVDLVFQKNMEDNIPEWAKFARAKSYGLELVVRNFDNFRGVGDTISHALGSAFGLLAQIEIRVLKLGKTEIVFTPAAGASYSTKTFFTHRENRFIGSHINEMLKADVGAQLSLSPNFKLLAGIGYVHLSNGGYLVPNGGLNTVNAYIGAKLTPNSDVKDRAEKPRKPSGIRPFQTLQRNSFEFMAGFGQRGVFEQKRAKYRSAFFAGYNFYMNDLITIKTGVDAIYYYTVFDPLDANETFQNYGTSYDRWRTGLSLSSDFNFWRVTINTQIGKYLHYNRFFKNATWYWGFGPTIYVTPHIGIQARTYMHFAQADYVNYGLVVKL